MRATFLSVFLVIILSSVISETFASENAFYILHSTSEVQKRKTEKLLQKLLPNHSKINIIISQAYRIDANGGVAGFVDESVKSFAHQNHIKLYALVTNIGFDKTAAHRFLTNPLAQQKAINSLLLACQKNRYTGIQFDFEGISIADREALTKFYTYASKKLHDYGYKVSFAVVPIVTGRERSEFQRRRYQNWSGAYDLKKLGQLADFISIMAYDQHTYGTLPGPIGGYNWVKVAIQETLRYVPAKKVSLGIPVYSGYWVMTNHPKKRLGIQLRQISYREVQALQEKYRVKLKWDPEDRIHFAFFNHHWLYDYLFVENAKSFKAKYSLMHQYKLRGISVFTLGNEDPDIWQLLS